MALPESRNDTYVTGQTLDAQTVDDLQDGEIGALHGRVQRLITVGEIFADPDTNPSNVKIQSNVQFLNGATSSLVFFQVALPLNAKLYRVRARVACTTNNFFRLQIFHFIDGSLQSTLDTSDSATGATPQWIEGTLATPFTSSSDTDVVVGTIANMGADTGVMRIYKILQDFSQLA